MVHVLQDDNESFDCKQPEELELLNKTSNLHDGINICNGQRAEETGIWKRDTWKRKIADSILMLFA